MPWFFTDIWCHFAEDNFVGETGGLFEEPPVPELPMQAEGDTTSQQQANEGM